ncbi:MAG: hypothetical protein ACOY58_08265, partial [Candidatus Micrarchaeota archaeon]
GVEIEGRLFHAFVPQGTKFEQALDRIISKYGGGVAKLKYESMEGKEIVAVMIGDRCMVKGEPDKVAKADFSAFGESASAMREIAVEHARSSRGGIHFFAGAGGIPIAAGKDGEVAFLNASEVEVGKDNRFFSVRQVDYDKDPKRISELGEGYISVTDKARGAMAGGLSQDDLASSHGGLRSEKLMLPESKILIFDINTQQVSTLAEFASPETGFKAPQFVPTMIAPQPQSAFTNVGIVFPTPRVDIHLPMDGSPSRIPYLFVKVFDGKLEDALNYKKEDGRYVPGWSTVPLKKEGGRLEAETCGRFTFVSYDRLPAEPHGPAKASAKPVQPGEDTGASPPKQAPAPQKKPDRKPRRRTSASRHIDRLPEQSSLRAGPIRQDGRPPDAPKRIPASEPPGLLTTPRKSCEERQRKRAKNKKPKKSRPKSVPAKDPGQIAKNSKKGAKDVEPLPKAKTRPNPNPRSKKPFMASQKPVSEPLRKAGRKAKAPKPTTYVSEPVSLETKRRPRKEKTAPRPKPGKISVQNPSGVRKATHPAAKEKKRKSKKKDRSHLEELLAPFPSRKRSRRRASKRAAGAA